MPAGQAGRVEDLPIGFHPIMNPALYAKKKGTGTMSRSLQKLA